MATSPNASVHGAIGFALGAGFGVSHGENMIELSVVRLRLRRGHDSDQRGVRMGGRFCVPRGAADEQPTRSVNRDDFFVRKAGRQEAK